MQQKVVDITGFANSLPFSSCDGTKDTYLVGEKHQKMRLKKYQNYMKFG